MCFRRGEVCRYHIASRLGDGKQWKKQGGKLGQIAASRSLGSSKYGQGSA